MRVEATSASYLYTASLRATERVQKITANAAQAASAPQAVEDAPREKIAKPVDFSRMTWDEMNRWIGVQYRNGEISLDEWHDTIFVLLAAGLRYEGANGSLDGVGDVVFDFTQIARDSIDWSRGLDDGGKCLKIFETALSVMQRHQRQDIGVDVFA